jgi:hypothetical protein
MGVNSVNKLIFLINHLDFSGPRENRRFSAVMILNDKKVPGLDIKHQRSKRKNKLTVYNNFTITS